MRVAAPVEHAAEVQAHVRVRIDVLADHPRTDGADVQPEFFVQFAMQRLRDGLARFELAAGKLPVARVWLARGPLREEELAIVTDQDAHRDVDDPRGVHASGGVAERPA
ncbi:MAG TPA: hypothetical protein VM764_00885 [Gemmatimonadaceae bacterium]|nr:hypothetical protein [Gemmatimonadaceae bacterium]